MTCKLAVSMASDQLDGLLTPDEEELYNAHLAQCRECGQRHDELVSVHALLSAVPPEPPASDLRARVLRTIVSDDRGSPWKRVWVRLTKTLLPAGLAPSTAGAAALLLLALGMLGPLRSVPTDAAIGGVTSETAAGAVGPAGARAARRAVLTVWDTSAERIVAAIDPSGLAPCEVAATTACVPMLAAVTAASEDLTAAPAAVRMYIYEHIEVRG